MHHHERFVIYGLLAVLLTLNGLMLLGQPSGPAANAAPLPDPSSTTSNAAPQRGDDILGPADGVELIGAGDAGNIVIRNSEGRPGWADDAYHQSRSIAYVHIGRILNELLNGEAYADERKTMQDEMQEKDADYRKRLTDLQGRMEGLDPNGAEAQNIAQQGNALLQEYRSWQQEAAARREQLGAEHLERAYRDLVNAVTVVADRLKIDMVYRFIPTDDAFESHSVEQATMAIRLRPLLHYPTDIDITPEVMEELALDAG